MDEFENFRKIIETSSEVTKLKWTAICDKIVSSAAAELGVQIDRSDVVRLPAARIAALSDTELGDFMVEVRRLPAVQKALEAQELRKALEAGSQEALASLPSDPARRMTAARALGLGQKTEEKPKLTAAQERELIKKISTLPPALRAARAREWGLL